jgi:hypothetical protein
MGNYKQEKAILGNLRTRDNKLIQSFSNIGLI